MGGFPPFGEGSGTVKKNCMSLIHDLGNFWCDLGTFWSDFRMQNHSVLNNLSDS